MMFLKVKNQDDRVVIINVSSISAIWESGENTIICLQHPDDYITVKQPIDKIEKMIYYHTKVSIIDSNNNT